MKSLRAGRAAALIAGSILALTACTGSSNGSGLRSGTVAPTTASSIDTTVTTAGETSTTEPATEGSAPEVASAEAESFKAIAPTIDELGDGVYRLIDEVEPARIDQLASVACGGVTAEMNDNELGLQGLAAYNRLTDAERVLIPLEDWVVFYGALIGFFCPENLPEFDATQAARSDGTDVEQFRTIVTDVDGVSVETESFVDRLSDQRLDELQTAACSRTNPDMNTEDFGLAIVDGYGTELTEAESSTITLSGYSELYGALVGWFCPANLPL